MRNLKNFVFAFLFQFFVTASISSLTNTEQEFILLEKGETIFKECKLCGQLNYDFASSCENCGNGNFTPVYLLPDVQKRDARHRRRHKDK